MSGKRIVVLHALRSDSRATTINHAACFGRYINDYEVEYINIFGLMPAHLQSEVVIVTYELASLRHLPIWKELVRRMEPLLKNSSLRILMPQDDYSISDPLDEFTVNHDFDYVFTPLTRDLEQIYPKSVKRGIKFEEAFTGYFENSDWFNLQKFSKPFSERSVDLGQRVRYLPPQLGESAARKGKLAVQFGREASKVGFSCDVSTREEDAFVGDAWWQFLGNTRFTISRRGGASLADPTGRLADKVRRYLLRHPEVTMEELSNRVTLKGGREGDFSAISPRLFEAAALGVCQILEPDEYVDGFEPWIHYIPLESDFSNINKVFDAMRDIDRCEEIVKSSQQLLLESGDFTYSAFVQKFRDITGIEANVEGSHSFSDSSEDFDDIVIRKTDALAWVQDYVLRAYLKRKIGPAISALEKKEFLVLHKQDVAWGQHAQAQSESVIRWLKAFQNDELLLESFLIPWRTMSSLIAK
ncbi:unannotated protein [freshwater metagenome]|uniref:Unannotated protein n=1 Tax=freshwater metagenome TaxID=449393 RepID=A0A6J6JWM7_9ZZZZ